MQISRIKLYLTQKVKKAYPLSPNSLTGQKRHFTLHKAQWTLGKEHNCFQHHVRCAKPKGFPYVVATHSQKFYIQLRFSTYSLVVFLQEKFFVIRNVRYSGFEVHSLQGRPNSTKGSVIILSFDRDVSRR